MLISNHLHLVWEKKKRQRQSMKWEAPGFTVRACRCFRWKLIKSRLQRLLFSGCRQRSQEWTPLTHKWDVHGSDGRVWVELDHPVTVSFNLQWVCFFGATSLCFQNSLLISHQDLSCHCKVASNIQTSINICSVKSCLVPPWLKCW